MKLIGAGKFDNKIGTPFVTIHKLGQYRNSPFFIFPSVIHILVNTNIHITFRNSYVNTPSFIIKVYFVLWYLVVFYKTFYFFRYVVPHRIGLFLKILTLYIVNFKSYFVNFIWHCIQLFKNGLVCLAPFGIRHRSQTLFKVLNVKVNHIFTFFLFAKIIISFQLTVRLKEISRIFFLILKNRWFKELVGGGVSELGELGIVLSHEVHDVA